MQACNQCGKCCLNYSTNGCGLLSATSRDLQLWREQRPDVLAYTGGFPHDLWTSPVTGEETERCPWLRKLPLKQKYKCRIHDVRPEICRDYPYDIDQMIADGCEMLEEGDLDKPREDLEAELEVLRNESGPAREPRMECVHCGERTHLWHTCDCSEPCNLVMRAPDCLAGRPCCEDCGGKPHLLWDQGLEEMRLRRSEGEKNRPRSD